MVQPCTSSGSMRRGKTLFYVAINYTSSIEKYIDENPTCIALCHMNFWNYHFEMFKHPKKKFGSTL